MQIIVLPLLILMAGCYTQLLTRPPLESTEGTDSSGQAQSTPAASTARDGCIDLAFRSGCWSVCDHCGRYHRYGYSYCPSSWYSSYWGWDYYDAYPWWYGGNYGSSYYPRHHYYSNGGGSGYSGGGSTAPPPKDMKRKYSLGEGDVPAVPLQKSSGTQDAPPAAPPAQGGGASVESPSTTKEVIHSDTPVKKKKRRDEVE